MFPKHILQKKKKVMGKWEITANKLFNMLRGAKCRKAQSNKEFE